MRTGRPKGSTGTHANLGMIAARKHAELALNALVRQLDSPVGSVVVSAASTILDRAWGKPAQAVEHSGKDGGPIETCEVSARDVLLDRLTSLAGRQSADVDKSLN